MDDVESRLNIIKALIKQEHDDGKCGGSCIYCPEPVIKFKDLTGNSKGRLKRIQELRKCDVQAALEFCISVGWLAAEKRANGVSSTRAISGRKGKQ